MLMYVIRACSLSSVAHHKSSSEISSSPATISNAVPNSSSLFNRNPTVLNPPKIINHGKPNLAPKPPPQLKLASSNNSVNTENNENLNNNGDSNRKAVARHQSMKSPRYSSNISLYSVVFSYINLLIFEIYL